MYMAYVLSFCVFPDGYNLCSVLPNLGSVFFKLGQTYLKKQLFLYMLMAKMIFANIFLDNQH